MGFNSAFKGLNGCSVYGSWHMYMFRGPRVHLQGDSCNKYRYGTICVYTCCTCTDFNPLPEDDPSASIHVYCVWNVMAHAQKPDFVFRRNGRVHLNRRGASVQSTTGSRGVIISGSNAGYTMFRSSVKSTGYPLHSPVSPSFPLPCVTVCHHI